MVLCVKGTLRAHHHIVADGDGAVHLRVLADPRPVTDADGAAGVEESAGLDIDVFAAFGKKTAADLIA